MGKKKRSKKRSWRRKHSPSHIKSESFGSDRSRGRQAGSRSSRVRSTGGVRRITTSASKDDKLAKAIHVSVLKSDFRSERLKNVLDVLLKRMYTQNAVLKLGRIEDFYIPIKYVKPPNTKVPPTIRKNYVITLSLYHGSHYIIVLKDEGGSGIPGILVCRETEGFVGAANYESWPDEFNYPSLLYTPETFEMLFKIPLVKPYEPSSSYGPVTGTTETDN